MSRQRTARQPVARQPIAAGLAMGLVAILGWAASAIAATPSTRAVDSGLDATALFRQINVDSGLPSNTVLDLEFDRQGFLWVATDDGLARFDGQQFRIWRSDPGDPRALRGNAIEELLIDRQDRIWVAPADAGLSVLDQTREGFVHVAVASEAAAGLRTGRVFALAEAADGTIWAGNFDGGLHRIDAQTLAVEAWPAPDTLGPLPDRTVTALAFDAAGWLWVGTLRGLVGLSPLYLAGDSSAPTIQLFPGGLIAFLSRDRQGVVWVTTRDQMYRLLHDADAGHPTAHAVEFPAGLFRAGSIGLKGLLSEPDTSWIASGQGLVEHRADGTWRRHMADPAQANSLPGNWVTALARDHEGGLWTAHRGAGLGYLLPQWRRFSFFPAIGPDVDIAGEVAPVIAACADGRLWMARADGNLRVIDTRTGRAREIVDPRPTEQRLNLPRTLACLADGGLVLTYRGGLSMLDPAGVALSHFGPTNPNTPPEFRDVPINRALEDRDGRLWLSLLSKGLARFDPRSGQLQNFPRAVNGPRSIAIGQLTLDAEGRLWVAGDGGLDRFNPTRNAFDAVLGLAEGRVDAFAFDPDGSVYVQQTGALLHARLRADGLETLRRWDGDDGLPPIAATGLMRDGAGGLWLTSSRGIALLAAPYDRVRPIGAADGLSIRSFSGRPPAQRADRTMFVSTDRGVLVFRGESIRGEPPPPPLAIEALSFTRDGRRVDWEPGDGALHLRHNDRNLTLAVRALSFIDPAGNRYRFKLKGYDQEWLDAGNRGDQVYTALPAGRYQLSASGAMAHGAWSPPLADIGIEVAPPPWSTPWAYAGYALGLLLLIAALLYANRLRLKRRHALVLAQERQREAERRSQIKSDFLADVGHELRTPMAGLLGMTELVLRDRLEQGQRQRLESIQRSGRDLVQLLNDLLDLSRIEAGRFELVVAEFDLQSLLDEVIALESAAAAARGLALDGRLDPTLTPRLTGDRRRLKQVLLNLVSNAIKFTDHGSVWLRIESAPDLGQRFVVRDTGRGISAADLANLFRRFEQVGVERRAGAGLGLSISKRLIEEMGGQITVSSETGRGSEFVVDLNLPAHEGDTDPAVPLASGSQTQTPAPPARVQRVLVVEDDATLREFLIAALHSSGHDAVAAEHGLAAIAALSAGRFDVALIDLDLPVLDGLGIVRWIGAQASDLRPAAIIAITASADPQMPQRCLDQGFDGFLRKPVSIDELLAAVAGDLPQQ